MKISYNPNSCKTFRNKWKFYTLEERYLRFLRDRVLDLDDYKSIINKIFSEVVGTDKSFIKKLFKLETNKEISSRGHTIGSHSHYHIGDFRDYKHSLKILKKG